MIPGQKLTLESSSQKLPLGTRFFDESTGKVWHYVQANEAITQYAALVAMVALYDSICAASSGKQLVDAAVSFSGNLVGGYVKINAGANSIDDVPNRITAITSVTELALETAWSVALTTSENYVVYKPYLIEESDAAAEKIIGVAQIAVTSGYYFWMQTGGLCDAVLVDGNTGSDAVVAFEGLVSSGTSGVLKGLTNAGTTTDEADKSNVTALVPTALAAQNVPCILNCLP